MIFCHGTCLVSTHESSTTLGSKEFLVLFIYLFDIQRHPHDIRIRAVAFLAEVRLEMVKIYYGEETDKEQGRCGN